jgi:hypothetical protein
VYGFKFRAFKGIGRRPIETARLKNTTGCYEHRPLMAASKKAARAIMLDHETKLCRCWARGKRNLTRVCFYGSRVWGGWRTDSDLDVLVVAPPGHYEAELWASELTKRLGVAALVNDYFTARPELLERIKASGLLVFSRHGTDADFEFEGELPEFDPDSP